MGNLSSIILSQFLGLRRATLTSLNYALLACKSFVPIVLGFTIFQIKSTKKDYLAVYRNNSLITLQTERIAGEPVEPLMVLRQNRSPLFAPFQGPLLNQPRNKVCE